ncbi:MAG: hypothetical protein Q9174_006384, partial [Haloplaca sp. 1 TL-2023]
MMRSQHLQYVSFEVFYHQERIYGGSVGLIYDSPNNQPKLSSDIDVNSTEKTSPQFAAPKPWELAVRPIPSSNAFVLTPPSSSALQEDHPRYDIAFNSQRRRASLIKDRFVLRTLILLLLQMAKADAQSIQPRIASMTHLGLQAWVFMEERPNLQHRLQ